jgi:hypothetical protein
MTDIPGIRCQRVEFNVIKWTDLVIIMYMCIWVMPGFNPAGAISYPVFVVLLIPCIKMSKQYNE